MEFPEGLGGGQFKKPSMGGVSIFSRTTQFSPIKESTGTHTD